MLRVWVDFGFPLSLCSYCLVCLTLFAFSEYDFNCYWALMRMNLQFFSFSGLFGCWIVTCELHVAVWLSKNIIEEKQQKSKIALAFFLPLRVKESNWCMSSTSGGLLLESLVRSFVAFPYILSTQVSVTTKNLAKWRIFRWWAVYVSLLRPSFTLLLSTYNTLLCLLPSRSFHPLQRHPLIRQNEMCLSYAITYL